MDEAKAKHAAQLMRPAGRRDVIDALVAVEALAFAPSVIITSDRKDFRPLLDSDPNHKGDLVKVHLV